MKKSSVSTEIRGDTANFWKKHSISKSKAPKSDMMMKPKEMMMRQKDMAKMIKRGMK